MNSLKLELPVYMETTKRKTELIGMNWYRNAHFHISNKIKKRYSEIIHLKLSQNEEFRLKYYEIHYRYFYKNVRSDLTNITSVIDKFLNDTLQEMGIVENDNVKYLKKVTCEVGGQDKENPRVEVEIVGI